MHDTPPQPTLLYMSVARPGSGRLRAARALAAPPGGGDSYAYRVAGLSVAAGTPWQLGGIDSPWRAPHHTVSLAGMTGTLRAHRWHPGELSLAHGGVLALDEAHEFRRGVWDFVRWAVEHGTLTLQSGEHRLVVPARPWAIVALTEPEHAARLPLWFRDRAQPLPAEVERSA